MVRMIAPICAMLSLAVATPISKAGPPLTDLWSLKPIVRPPVPRVHDAARVVNPIDAFILARLEARHLHLAAPADRRSLIRRVTFDLTGLPPTTEEVDRFINDSEARAYERVVDRLLASPRYGERWARHWLDVVRFAESQGYEMNQPRPAAWPYRDYVIASFNEDKPYSQFVREQLAGDAMGADAATGYLVAGPYDEVKSPDPALTAQQRADELHDMVSTTGATFVGLTVGCARCHDHKFDPITQVDYYRMQALFAGVQHGERTVRSVASLERFRRLQEARVAVDAKLAALEPIAAGDASGSRVAARPAVNPTRNLEHFTPVEAKYVRLKITGTNGAEPCIDELEIFAAGDDTHDIALVAGGAKATASSLLPGYAIHRIEHLIDGAYGNEHSWISNEVGAGWVQIELSRPVTIDRIAWSRDREGRFSDRLATEYTIETATQPGQWTVVASSADRLSYDAAPTQATGPQAPSVQLSSEQESLLDQDKSLAREQKAAAAAQVVYAGRFVQPEATHRLYRGDAMQPREAVAPAGIAAVRPTLELADNAPEQRRRVALAGWITSPDNPLTARVIVNRLWQYHFGRGIVETPSDFGHMGSAPSNPELLDWLATELVHQGWRIKAIQRSIVLSAAYRQSSVFDPVAARTDAGAALLWRFPPQRLEAEQIRDAILSVSGKLDLAMGGPGYDAFKPNNNYVRVYLPRDDFGPAEWRRMIYQFKPRLQQDGTFGAFDCPDGGQIAPKRGSSTTPLQALNLLNSPFVLQQANFFAGRIRQEVGAEPAGQVDRAFRLAFGRPPATDEAAAAVAMVRNHGLALLCRTLLNANEFLYVF